MKRTNLTQLSESQETVIQDGASNEKCAINYEDELPESVKLYQENKLKKWKKNRMNRLRKRNKKGRFFIWYKLIFCILKKRNYHFISVLNL